MCGLTPQAKRGTHRAASSGYLRRAKNWGTQNAAGRQNLRLWMERGAGQAKAFELSRRSRKQHLSRRWGRTMLRRHFVPDSPWPRGAAPGTTRRGARGNMGGCSRFLKVLGSPPLFSAGRRILCEVALREPHSGATRRPNEGVRSQSGRPEKKLLSRHRGGIRPRQQFALDTARPRRGFVG